jgi:trimethylamine--corrinoid protein Co-methyltransferase
MPKPKFSLLSVDDIKLIHEKALYVLENVGVLVDHEEVIEMLKNAGCTVNGKIVKIPRDLVEWSLKVVPKEITIYDRDSKPYVTIGGGVDESYFRPGSAALYLYDPIKDEKRLPTTKDNVNVILLVNSLNNIKLTCPSFVPRDVPNELIEVAREYVTLKYTNKPLETSGFSEEGVRNIIRMLKIVVGDVSKKPMQVFPACPSPPLKWSHLIAQNIIDLAKEKLPVTVLPMPQIGGTGPATIAGSLVQHHAEALSGIVIAQLVNRGAPVVYGGSPCLIEPLYGTANIATPETMLLYTAYVEIAKYLGLPTEGYIGLSDSRRVDVQAGAETLMGAIIAALKGINICAGTGMLEFESVVSLEKLVIDDEIVGLAYRLTRGFDINDETLAVDVIASVKPGGTFLGQRHTAKWVRREYFLTKIFDRMDESRFISRDKPTIIKLARERVEEILKKPVIYELPKDIERDLDKWVQEICGRYGVVLKV